MDVLFLIIRRAIIGTFLILLLLGIVGAAYLESTLPSVEMLKDYRLQVPLRVYSSDGKLIAEFGEVRRTPIHLDQVPKDLINAILATEDRRFYDHPGVDFRGLIRAAIHLMTHVSVKQGGSTITMQVARNYFLTRKKTFVRKISEILLALKIEKEFSKDEILELYLNKIYFGKRAYGIAAAAEVYYGTTVDKLTLDQIAMLAGLPQAPSSINPLHDQDAAYKRRKLVLDQMLSYDFITREQYNKAVDAPLPTYYHGRTIELEAPYVAEMVRQDLFNRYGDAIYTLGYEVYTTVDSASQTAANNALWRALLEYDQRHGFRRNKVQHFNIARNKKPEDMKDDLLEQLEDVEAYGPLKPGVVLSTGKGLKVLLQDGQTIDIAPANYSWTGGFKVGDVIYAYQSLAQQMQLQNAYGAPAHHQNAHNQNTAPIWKVGQVPEIEGALVSLHPSTGELMALVGGFDYKLSNFNRATQAERQLGSNFKPFLYASALAQGYTLASVFNDGPLTYVDPVTKVAWSPHNSSGRFYGPTRLRVALKRSQNMVTVRVLQAVGIPTAIDYISQFGFDRKQLPPVMSMALGVANFTPLQVVTGYAVFANGGNRVTPNFIKKITDDSGNLVYEATPPPPVPAISPQVAYLITSALHDVIQSGTGVRAKALGRDDLSGKTGTTDNWQDAWFSGYNRDVVTTAWVGFDDNRSTREYGAAAALPMWMYYMSEVLKDKPENSPPMPPGIVSVKIDPGSGRVSHGGGGVYEVFTDDTVPESSGGWWSGSGEYEAGGDNRGYYNQYDMNRGYNNGYGYDNNNNNNGGYAGDSLF